VIGKSGEAATRASHPGREFVHAALRELARAFATSCEGLSLRHRRRIARAVPHAVNDDLVALDGVKNEIRIGMRDDTTQASFASQRPGIRVAQDKIDDLLNARLEAARALRRMNADAIEHFGQLSRRAKRVSEFQSPCFAQMARTWSSVANCPRSAWRKDSSNDAASSDVNATTG
jgi:hypothetical protein